MDRRHFCKIAALAVGSIGLGGLQEAEAKPAAQSGRMARGCRVAVIRKECYEDFQSLYLDDPETGRCRMFSTGDIYEFKAGDTCPAGFCPAAFEAIRNCTAGIQVCPDIAEYRGTLLASCPGGSRPVIFRLELDA